MPFNGVGMFVRVRNWVADATAGIKIRADFHDTEDDNFAAGISQCIARDGQSTIIANIPMNSKRLISLADPVDNQDASTKAYADTKLSTLTGGTVNAAVTVNGGFTSTAWIMSRGYRCRQGLDGGYGGNWFNFNWNGSTFEMWADNYHFGEAATTAYVEQRASDWAHAVADPKVNRAGDTVTGDLSASRFNSNSNIYYFQWGGYLQWNGGGTYTFGGGGTAWHTGNLAPVTNARWIDLGQQQLLAYGWSDWGKQNGVYALYKDNSMGFPVTYVKLHYLQILVPSGWVTVG